METATMTTEKPAAETCTTGSCSVDLGSVATIEKPTKKVKKVKKSMLPRKAAYFILYVPDMAKAVAFYKDTLHMKVGCESAEWTEIKAGIKFALHAMPAAEFKPAKTGLVFGVKNAQKSYEAFNALGVKTLGEPRQVCEEGRSFCFEDPFGNTMSCYGK